MKNLNLALIAIIMAGVFYLSFTEKTPPKPEGENYEIMYVEIDLIMGADGIFVFRQDQEPELIDISIMQSKSNIMKNGKIIRDFFQRCYDEGWEIESEVSTETINRYILKRKK